MNRSRLILLILSVVSLLLIAIFAYFYFPKALNTSTSVQELVIYKAFGVRDTNKVEQTVFSLGDPILIKMPFVNAESGTVVMVTVEDLQGKMFQEVEIPLAESGERYISVFTNNFTSGNYLVKVTQNDYLLSESLFTIK
jgi:hypothetical protein